MSRLKFLGIAVLAVFALSASVASSAFAEEKTKMLPESGVSFTAKGGPGKLVQKEGLFTVECKKNKGSGTIESANLGKYKVDFEECKAAGGPCTGVGEAKEVILNEGTYHFWLAKEETKLVGVLAALPIELHFSCVVLGITQLVVVKGCDAALTRPLNTLASKTEDVAVQSGGVQLITKVLPQESTTESTCELLSSLEGGTFKQSALEGVEENEKFTSGGKEITVLLMNPEAVE